MEAIDADFIGKPIVVGSKNSLVFSKEDALVPFISRNKSMWEFFAPELKRRLSMWQRSWATANARCSASCRRKTTSFQKQLNHTRELLAKTYLANTDMPAADSPARSAGAGVPSAALAAAALSPDFGPEKGRRNKNPALTKRTVATHESGKAR